MGDVTVQSKPGLSNLSMVLSYQSCRSLKLGSPSTPPTLHRKSHPLPCFHLDAHKITLSTVQVRMYICMITTCRLVYQGPACHCPSVYSNTAVWNLSCATVRCKDQISYIYLYHLYSERINDTISILTSSILTFRLFSARITSISNPTNHALCDPVY